MFSENLGGLLKVKLIKYVDKIYSFENSSGNNNIIKNNNSDNTIKKYTDSNDSDTVIII
jgi:hypothetical protein